MNTKFVYALVLTISLAVFSLLSFLTGFQTEKLAQGQHLGWLSVVIQIVVLWLGIRAVREVAPNKALSYGQGVGTGVLISLYAGLMSAVYNFVHFKFINPDYFDYQIAMMREKWVEKGMAASQMDQAETMTRKFMGPVSAALFTPFTLVLLGVIISLVVAAILKRPAPADLPTEPPAVP